MSKDDETRVEDETVQQTAGGRKAAAGKKSTAGIKPKLEDGKDARRTGRGRVPQQEAVSSKVYFLGIFFAILFLLEIIVQMFGIRG